MGDVNTGRTNFIPFYKQLKKGPQQMGEPRIVIARSEEVLSVVFLLLRAAPF